MTNTVHCQDVDNLFEENNAVRLLPINILPFTSESSNQRMPSLQRTAIQPACVHQVKVNRPISPSYVALSEFSQGPSTSSISSTTNAPISTIYLPHPLSKLSYSIAPIRKPPEHQQPPSFKVHSAQQNPSQHRQIQPHWLPFDPSQNTVPKAGSANQDYLKQQPYFIFPYRDHPNYGLKTSDTKLNDSDNENLGYLQPKHLPLYPEHPKQELAHPKSSFKNSTHGEQTPTHQQTTWMQENSSQTNTQIRSNLELEPLRDPIRENGGRSQTRNPNQQAPIDSTLYDPAKPYPNPHQAYDPLQSTAHDGYSFRQLAFQPPSVGLNGVRMERLTRESLLEKPRLGPSLENPFSDKPSVSFKKPLETNESPGPDLDKRPTRITIKGHNVSKETVVDGFVQFFVYHHPKCLEDSDLIRQKITKLPNAHCQDLDYSVWDLYQHIVGLHKGHIKTWSQLVGRLGVKNASRRTQFTQKIKKWMKKNKIDCYFNYLLGNDYDFHDPDSTRNSSIFSITSKIKEGKEEEEEEETADEEEPKPMILPAGSRKRLRLDNDPEKLRQAAEVFIKLRRHATESEEDLPTDQKRKLPEDLKVKTKRREKKSRAFIRHTTTEIPDEPLTDSPVQHSDPETDIPARKSKTLTRSCPNCHTLGIELISLQNEVTRLNAHIDTIKKNLKQQEKLSESGQQYINQLLLEKLKKNGPYKGWKHRLSQNTLHHSTLLEDNQE
ncbi:ARS binding protein 2-domain-containing protein [Sporodiniella umbellata]|nr:ARS binding protein 2-domain-containing protein [Sporodiniella umbellata]